MPVLMLYVIPVEVRPGAGKPSLEAATKNLGRTCCACCPFIVQAGISVCGCYYSSQSHLISCQTSTPLSASCRLPLGSSRLDARAWRRSH